MDLLDDELRTTMVAQQIYSEEEMKFLGQYPKMAKVVDRITRDLPKNWIIAHELQSEIKG